MTEAEFSERYLSALNEQQRDAVRTTEGAVLLLAVPGSGKTTVLITRLGYMTLCRGVDPRSILTMTYTRAATREMQTRFAHRFDPAAARAITFSTINALSLQIVRRYSESHGRGEPFEQLSEQEGSRILAELYHTLTDDYATDSTLKDLRTAITYVKNMMLTGEELRALDVGVDCFPELYTRYNLELRQRRRMDFDDQMVYALQILRSYPDILDSCQERYRYLCVDESQDTSKIQHEIIRLLARKYGNLFMVGDEDQSIYGFRAAYPEALMRFREDHPGAKVLLLEQNYRSGQEIVSAAAGFVTRNTDRYEKKMAAVRGAVLPVRVITAADRETQYHYLFCAARNCREQTAVLYRNNDSALPLIDLFERQGIPYQCRSFDATFFSHRVVTDVCDLLRFSLDPRDRDCFLRIYYKLSSPITKSAAVAACEKSAVSGKTVLEELLETPELSSYGRQAVRDLQEQFIALPSDRGEAVINRVRYGLRYGQFAEERKLDTGKFSILGLLARQTTCAEEFLRRLEELRILVPEHANTPDAPFLLSTIHSSKGLEYDRVYLLDILDGILPQKKEEALESEEDRRLYQEERRLYYVGMTRAKNELLLFRCRGAASSFTAEIQRNLPREDFDEDDLFTSLRGDLMGRTYTHSSLGKGEVTAQCGTRLLLRFSDGEYRLFTLEELLEQRDRTVRYRQSDPAPSPASPPGKKKKASVPVETPHLAIGAPVRHRKFGKGVITELNPAKDRIAIHFEINGKIKNFGLRVLLDRGLLESAEEPEY